MNYLRYRRLSSSLLPEKENRKPPDTLIKRKVIIVQQPGGSLEVSLLEDDDTVVTRKSYSKQADDFHCDGTELVFSNWSGMGTAGLGLGSTETSFNKGIDGSLIIRHNSHGAGLGMLIFPIVVLRDIEWLRYRQLEH
jgi:hypothetical protein